MMTRLLCLFLCLPFMAMGQTTPAPAGLWSYSLGAQRYAEPAMQLVGPEIGLHWRSRPLVGLRQAQLEADALVGLQKYSSDDSGTKKNVPNIETRWRVLWPSHLNPHLSYGLALNTHSNYLNVEGRLTSTGRGGYERQSTQFWLPVRWSDSGENWSAFGPVKSVRIDAGVLLLGKHFSKLSQVNAKTYTDVNNTQHTGIYLQSQLDYSTASGMYSPYVRWTWVDDSDKVNGLVSGKQGVSNEPINRRLQIGVEWKYWR
jgi:hypothetical protein